MFSVVTPFRRVRYRFVSLYLIVLGGDSLIGGWMASNPTGMMMMGIDTSGGAMANQQAAVALDGQPFCPKLQGRSLTRRIVRNM